MPERTDLEFDSNAIFFSSFDTFIKPSVEHLKASALGLFDRTKHPKKSAQKDYSEIKTTNQRPANKPAVEQDPQAELRSAAFRGDLAAVIHLVKMLKLLKPKAFEPGRDSLRTVLHWAASEGHVQVVSYLLKATRELVDVNAQDKDKNTALHLVVQNPNMPLTKRIAIITLLLSHGANPVLENVHKETPLMCILPLRNKIAADYPHMREGMNTIISKIKMWIYDKARELNRTVTISPNGEVSLDKTGIPVQDPRTVLAEQNLPIYRSLAMARS